MSLGSLVGNCADRKTVLLFFFRLTINKDGLFQCRTSAIIFLMYALTAAAIDMTFQNPKYVGILLHTCSASGLIDVHATAASSPDEDVQPTSSLSNGVASASVGTFRSHDVRFRTAFNRRTYEIDWCALRMSSSSFLNLRALYVSQHGE